MGSAANLPWRRTLASILNMAILRKVRMKASATRFAAVSNAFVIAVGMLWAHKLRSMLTVFGIVVGIAAVVLAGATLLSVRDMAVKSTAQSFGANTFIVSQVASLGNLSRKELSNKLRKNPKIYRREAEKLTTRMNDSALLAPALQSVSDIKAGNKTFLAASVVGSTANVQIIRNIKLDSGRFFTEEENRRSRGVAVIGQALVKELFPSLDPLGKQIRIKGQLFIVIGTQEKQGSSLRLFPGSKRLDSAAGLRKDLGEQAFRDDLRNSAGNGALFGNTGRNACRPAQHAPVETQNRG